MLEEGEEEDRRGGMGRELGGWKGRLVSKWERVGRVQWGPSFDPKGRGLFGGRERGRRG